ncbi:MAG: hypothetical protein D6800_05445, partial [Candidatus Zixiibacteriota bacterium]
HRKFDSPEASRCCRMVRNLRREMVMLNDHIDDYLTARTERRLKLAKMTRYLAEELPRQLEQSMAQYQQQLEAVVELSKGLAELQQGMNKLAAPTPGGNRRSAVSDTGGTTFTYTDTLRRVSRQNMVFVTNPSGDVRITGWNKPMITAELTFAVAADSPADEQNFAKHTVLSLDAGTNRYTVGARYPQRQTQPAHLLRSSLVVRLPETNPVNTESGFGQISVSNLNTTVQVTGHHADIDLDQLNGSVAVSNNQGSIHAAAIEGALSVSQINGQVEVSNCKGGISLANSSGAINLSDCSGKVRLSGSGTAITTEHVEGTLTIENSYGSVEVRNVDGDLTVTNAYDIIRLRNVRGHTRIGNSYSSISAYRLAGPVNVTNTYGAINLESFSGPLSVENEGAAIQLVIDDKLTGTSRVFNDNGDITIELPATDDL